jgi:pSer/pThr/pTyr-binding forkhead associated (FHA) protein
MVAENDSDDKTRIAATPPPQLKPPSPAKKAANEEPEHTQIASVPPPVLKGPPETPAAASVPPSPERTRVVDLPPPTPKQPSAAASPSTAAASEPVAVARPAPQPAQRPETSTPARPAPAAPVGEEDEGTIIITQRVRATVRLQRVQPAGRSETIGLDRSSYLLGRSHTCDIQLYSRTASRVHARLTHRDGKWHVEPVEDRMVLANGVRVRDETLVTHKMRLQLGGDELLFLDDKAVSETPAGVPAPVARPRRSTAVLVAVVVISIAAALWWVLWPMRR